MAEGRAAGWARLGIAEISAKVGALIRQGRPLPVVLAGLCEIFDANVKGFSSVVLLVDQPDTRARAAAVPSLRLHEVSPILSLTGEPLGVFALYRREGHSEVTRCHSALLPHFIHVASAAIERVRSDEALKRSGALLERTQQLSSTCCFSWRVETGEISGSKELCRLFDLGSADAPMTMELIGARIHSEDLPLFQTTIERARRGVSDFEFEHRIRLSDNSVKYLRVVAQRTRDQEGNLEYIGAVQDVTHRRNTEEALAGLRGELMREGKVTSLGVLTAAIAHEVNQPKGPLAFKTVDYFLSLEIRTGGGALIWLWQDHGVLRLPPS